MLCFGFSDFVLPVVLRIFGFCASRCASIFSGFCVQFCASRCASMFFLRILCWILCFSLCFEFSDFVLDFPFLAAFRISDCAKSCARRIQQAEIRSTRNQELEHEKPRIFFPTQITEIEGLVLRPLVLCSRPLALVLPALGSGAPGPWFWCSRPLVLVLSP